MVTAFTEKVNQPIGFAKFAIMIRTLIIAIAYIWLRGFSRHKPAPPFFFDRWPRPLAPAEL